MERVEKTRPPRRLKQKQVAECLAAGVYFIADCIGFVVGEFRLHVVPAVRVGVRHLRWRWRQYRARRHDVPRGAIARQEPEFQVLIRDHQASGGGNPSGTAPLPQTEPLSVRRYKYDYDWAVARITELEAFGISDPIAYFNNEMTDWWLAPGGMMEEEADFVGIARVIEEHWHT
ncbi:hypothetical protein [Sneathiella chinensis]|uniref:Uncharacterized protein n=1 Tax=Sneathiella chinensis TaxID=349750 RepID=A0ABQ5U4A4_9PROT|nr:hypothetical protein [Sneathiella chinensis]GLQ06500.1 hypothetical protein GCM10007924_17210 [Sneathiella chinensis]